MKVWSPTLIFLALQNNSDKNMPRISLLILCSTQKFEIRKPKMLEANVLASWELQIWRMEPGISRTLGFTVSNESGFINSSQKSMSS